MLCSSRLDYPMLPERQAGLSFDFAIPRRSLAAAALRFGFPLPRSLALAGNLFSFSACVPFSAGHPCAVDGASPFRQGTNVRWMARAPFLCQALYDDAP